MMNSIIDSPYINLPIGKATPALILGILYLFVLVGFLCYGKKKHTLIFHVIRLETCSKGKQNRIWLSLCGYILLVFVCIVLPSFLEEETPIVVFSKAYLQYEPLVALCVFVFLCSSIFNTKNRERQLTACNGFFQCVIQISIGAGLLTDQINLSLWQNRFIVVVAGIIYFLLLVIEIKAVIVENNSCFNYNWLSYSPVRTVEELFPNHRIQAEQIADLISCSSSDPFSICVSGKWGTGKTSVINGAVELLNKKSSDSYSFIRINALELDSKESMFRYLMTQIKHCLREKGVYVGVNSEYKEFVASTAGTVTTEAIGTLLQKRLFDTKDDYREQKKNLGEIIERTFVGGKLVVIVDDIERCDDSTAKEYIFLIKEIATMKNCVSVFVTNYSLLNQLFEIEDNASHADTSAPSNSFLDKFFNFKIDLFDETPENILEFYDRGFSEKDEDFWSIYQIAGMSPASWYCSVLQGLDSEINSLSEESKRMYLDMKRVKLREDKIDGLKRCRELLVERMQIPRNIVTFYNVFRKNVHHCYRSLFLVSAGIEHENVNKYIKTRNVGQVMLFLAFASACLPDEMYQLKRKGAAHITPSWDIKPEEIGVERQLLLDIANGLLFDQYTKKQEPNSYLKQEIFRFIDAFLDPSFELIQLCRPFTTQEEEWISAIDSNHTKIIKSNWNEMMVMVLQKVSLEDPNQTNKWRNDYFSSLMKFAETQVELGIWDTDVVFSLFEHGVRADVYLATGTGLMQSFWNHICNSKVFKVPSKKRYEDLLSFSNHYAYKRVDSIYRLAHYLLKKDDYEKVKHLQEILLDSTNSLVKNLSQFVTQLAENIPGLLLPNSGWLDDYKVLSGHIRSSLDDWGLLEYPDVNDEAVQMMDAANELLSLEQLLEWCKLGASKKHPVVTTATISSNLEDVLLYFEDVFQNPTAYRRRDTYTEFADLFKALQNSQNLTPTQNEIAHLHKLVTLFIADSGYSSLPYRKVLVELSEKAKQPQQI